MSVPVSPRRPFSSRAILVLVWAASFVVLGLIGVRLHGSESVSYAAAATAVPQSVVEAVEPGASPATAHEAVLEQGSGAASEPAGAGRLDLLIFCAIALLIALALLAPLALRSLQSILVVPRRERAGPVGSPSVRQRPLYLLFAVSRI